MQTIGGALGLVVGELSDQNYAQSLDFYRFWLGTGQADIQVPPDQIFDALWNNRVASSIQQNGEIFHSTAHLIPRFASDAESDRILCPYSSELQSRLCTRSLREFSSNNLMIARYGQDAVREFYADANLVAHWANLGYLEEAAIRDRVLQSLTSHPKLYDHQADALIILFKLAGATFEAYADPSVVDRCFELLRVHNYTRPFPIGYSYDTIANKYLRAKKDSVQEVVASRERRWEGLPPPPLFTSGGPGPTGVRREDPAATLVITSLGLPNRGLETRILHISKTVKLLWESLWYSPEHHSNRAVLLMQDSLSEPVAVPETGTIPPSPFTQSPSISISTLSDLTIADAPDDEHPNSPTFADTSDDEPLVNTPAVAPHETFHLNDGNVEVLCGNTLFRVHVSTLSFHSPVLRRMFSQTNLATAESANGCPRILASDTAEDFATLLKTIYLPGFPERNKVPDFTTFSSLLRITAKYEMPAIRFQILEVVRDAYPETFEGLSPSKPLGERVFSGRIPHPNEVLNLFVQQGLTSALPMAYYMATRRGPDSLIGSHLPRNATLSTEILRSAIRGLVALHRAELNETHRLIFGTKGSHSCSASGCPSRNPAGTPALAAYQKVFDHVVGSSQLGSKVLEVPDFYEDRGGDLQCVGPNICVNCVERWESGHAELRKKVWETLPAAFGLV